MFNKLMFDSEEDEQKYIQKYKILDDTIIASFELERIQKEKKSEQSRRVETRDIEWEAYFSQEI